MKQISTKTILLDRLKQARGEWLSGQMLSQSLAISRAAVFKNIQVLRQEGYQIQAVTNKGYRLVAIPDRLLGMEVQQGLKTRTFGQKRIYHFDVIDSTNTRARELADAGAAEGTLVLAEAQRAGRGRRGRVWVSPAGGGIYLSMIARPSISPAEAPKITLLTAVALADAILKQTGLTVEIKWPNDLLIQGCKLAGILTELRTEMDLVEYVIVGMGVNVNTNAQSLRSVTDYKTTSLVMELGGEFSRLALLQTFLTEFETLYGTLVTQEFEKVLARWKELSAIIGRHVSVDVAGRTRAGRVLDVEPTGVLVIESIAGDIERIFSGDVTLT